jgi:hypothetical protein
MLKERMKSSEGQPHAFCFGGILTPAPSRAQTHSLRQTTMTENSVTRTPALACDRAALKTGIVHFGVGGFHRSHQQVHPFSFSPSQSCAPTFGRKKTPNSFLQPTTPPLVSRARAR